MSCTNLEAYSSARQGVRLFTCDMIEDEGGWTLVLDSNREHDSDTVADFEATMTELH